MPFVVKKFGQGRVQVVSRSQGFGVECRTCGASRDYRSNPIAEQIALMHAMRRDASDRCLPLAAG
ncbi:hypothetical protein [Streptomyces sp. ISL-94]|uniref:hypothetical protein n=1 Tax=Streptomyces sp. ISL-94 TaxID=2819190 RepID=UPI001BE5738E|nr:hypothetical protein [Streptomyces sp. ISL-94]MBT2477623.1 hypothetical protein [Streptomyces sp. ISL-94]